MRKLLAILTVGAACFFAGRVSRQQPVNAEGGGGGGGKPPACADLNVDGGVDISDAVYLLSCLFMGGPCPEFPPPEGQRVGLPDTGQTTCYDEAGKDIPCDSEACPGQDGFYETGCSMEDRFADNGDGTVTDTCTGLMWQQNTADVNGDGEVTERDDSPDRLPWCEALAYCENLTFAGHDDWRLPNVRELLSIIDYGRFEPAVDSVFGALMSWYWSSASDVDDPDAAWGVSFIHGVVNLLYKSNRSYVRAVRSGS